MHVSYLVDGYNLLFHLGLFDRRVGAHALEYARDRLLDYLKQSFGDADVTVIFDSGQAARKTSSPQDCQGIHVQYASRGLEADDVIEELIAQCACPRELVVISNDHRIQQAARRKGAQAWSGDNFLDYRARPAQQAGSASEADVRPPPSRAEVQHWLAEFGDLANNPEFRELFERYPFEDDLDQQPP